MNGIYQLIEKDYMLQFNGSKTVAFYNLKKDRLLTHNIMESTDDYISFENKLKAIIQSYQERLNKNKLTVN